MILTEFQHRQRNQHRVNALSSVDLLIVVPAAAVVVGKIVVSPRNIPVRVAPEIAIFGDPKGFGDAEGNGHVDHDGVHGQLLFQVIEARNCGVEGKVSAGPRIYGVVENG